METSQIIHQAGFGLHSRDNNLREQNIETALLDDTRITFKVGFVFASLLYTTFWIVDLFYVPNLNWIFLGLRLIHLSFVFSLSIYFRKGRSLRDYQIAGIAWAAIAANIITVMISLSHDFSSPYYGGLNLVALLAIFFIPYSPIIQMVALFSIFSPYYFAFALFANKSDLLAMCIYSSFMAGTVSIAILIRKLNFDTRCREVDAKLALVFEIEHREEIIQRKTAEGIGNPEGESAKGFRDSICCLGRIQKG